MTETDENLYKRFEKIINEHSGWRLKLRWFFHPSRKKLAVKVMVNSYKFMKCLQDNNSAELDIDTTAVTPIDILAKTLPSYTFIQEQKCEE